MIVLALRDAIEKSYHFLLFVTIFCVLDISWRRSRHGRSRVSVEKADQVLSEANAEFEKLRGRTGRFTWSDWLFYVENVKSFAKRWRHKKPR